MTQQLDTIIVGQGLAGSLLAWELVRHQQHVLVISDPTAPCSTRVAAGVVNPVTGQRLVLQADTSIHLNAALTIYRELEQFFGIQLFHELPMLRIANPDQPEWQRFLKRLEQHEYQGFLRVAAPSELNTVTADGKAVSGWMQLQTGYLDTNLLLDTLRNYFKSKHVLQEREFDYSELSWAAEKSNFPLQWHNFRASRIIFCEGAQMLNNPWFGHLPLHPAKGEILTLSRQNPLPEFMLHYGQWMVPQHHQFKIGATYDTQNINVEPTEFAKQTLLDGARRYFPAIDQAQVLEHRAGLRPTTKDKQPLIGWHPEHSFMGVFNGFGSRGSMLVPWHAQVFAQTLLHHTKLPEYADIRRFEQKKHQARLPLTSLAQQRVAEVLESGDIAIDATAGNGHDTHFLAQSVVPDGYVYAMDIQQQAIDQTRQRLANASEPLAPVQYICDSHTHLLKHLQCGHCGQIKVVMFNLGYLPGSDKSVITQTDSTLIALDAALSVLVPQGILSVMVYPGHPGGKSEADSVELWVKEQKTNGVVSVDIVGGNQAHAPRLYCLTKKS